MNLAPSLFIEKGNFQPPNYDETSNDASRSPTPLLLSSLLNLVFTKPKHTLFTIPTSISIVHSILSQFAMSQANEMSMFVPQAFQQLLAAYSPAQIADMAQSAAYIGGGSNSGENKSSKDASKKKKTVAVAVKAKATRPLNSWMAFRSMYNTISVSDQC